MPTVVTMPKWGLTMTAGTVTNWIASEGETVSAGAPLLTVETEKAVNDVESPADGVLVKIVAASGAEVPVSGPVAILAAPGETVSDDAIATLLAAGAVVSATGAAPAVATGPREARVASRDASGRVNASPAARKLAAELGVDLGTVEATGPGGRITSDDVHRAVAAQADAAAQPREERVTIADGRELVALVAGPLDAPADVVFLHGLGGSLSTWSSVLGELVDAYRVAAIDLPGHGKSDKRAPADADYSVAGLAAATGEAIAELGLVPAVVVGHSLGGAVAMQLALDRPKLVRALVLVDSVGLGTEIGGELLDRIEAEPSREEVRKLLELFFEDKRLVLERGVDEMAQARAAEGGDAAMKAIAAAAFSREGQRTGLEQRLGELNVPTFVVWGELDRVIPVSQADPAQRAIPGAWLDVMEGIGHVPQVEAASAFANLVEDFVASLPPVRQSVEPEPSEPGAPAEPEPDAAETAPAP